MMNDQIETIDGKKINLKEIKCPIHGDELIVIEVNFDVGETHRLDPFTSSHIDGRGEFHNSLRGRYCNEQGFTVEMQCKYGCCFTFEGKNVIHFEDKNFVKA